MFDRIIGIILFPVVLVTMFLFQWFWSQIYGVIAAADMAWTATVSLCWYGDETQAQQDFDSLGDLYYGKCIGEVQELKRQRRDSHRLHTAR